MGDKNKHKKNNELNDKLHGSNESKNEEPKIYNIKKTDKSNRRDFLRNSIAAGSTALTSGLLSACEKEESRFKVVQEMRVEGIFKLENLCFNNDGTILACNGNKFVYLWSIPDGELLKKIELTVEYYQISTLIFSPDNEHLYIATAPSNIYIINTKDGSVINTIDNDYVLSLAVNKSNTILASSDNKNKIKLWDLPNGNLLKSISVSHYANSLSINRESNVLASGHRTSGTSGLMSLWSIPGGELIDSSSENTGYYWVQFNPKNNTLASADSWARLYIVNLDNKQTLISVDAFSNYIKQIDYSSDGELIATIGYDLASNEKVKIWNTKTLELETSFNARFLSEIKFHPDGNIIAINEARGDIDEKAGCITLWAVSSGEQIKTPGAECQCNSVCTCDTVMSNESGNICECNSVESCRCNEVCSCNSVCSCDSHSSGGTYWYPN